MVEKTFLYGLNAGGSSYVDTQGNVFQADTSSEFRRFTTTADIGGTADDTLYQSENWSRDGLSYHVEVSDGLYYVETHFAEIYFDEEERRIFDVMLEDRTVINDLDIAARTGGADQAFVTGTFVYVTDGVLSLDLVAGTQNPKLSAFSVWSVLDEDAPTIAISLTGGTDEDDPVTVTVTFADLDALAAETVELGDLTIEGFGTYETLTSSISFSADGKSATATYEILELGGWSSNPVAFRIADGAIEDSDGNGNTETSATFRADTPFDGIDPTEDVDPDAVGKVKITITPSDNVQVSSFSKSAFTVTNLGDKSIAAIHFDVTDAVMTDAVFDPLGLAGDSVARGFETSNAGGTGVVDYTGDAILDPFIGDGGAAGYEEMVIRFDADTNGGFQSGEFIKFGVDMDPNSIVDIGRFAVDIDGNSPTAASWDIGGVSGAELSGTKVEVLFTDGTSAVSYVFADGTQAGGVAVIGQNSDILDIDLSINGLTGGQVGLVQDDNSVIVDGPAGQTIDIMMMTGFTQPFDFIDPDGNLVSPTDRLIDGDDPFLANNALEVQVQRVTLTGQPQDITALFDFAPPGGPLAFEGDDTLSYAFTAIGIDENGDPFGKQVDPIYIRPVVLAGDTNAPDVSIELTEADNAISPVEVTVTYSDDLALDPLSLSVDALQLSYGGNPVEVLWSKLTIADDGLTATAQYYVLPADGAWADDQTLTVSMDENAARDLANNESAAVAATFTFQEPDDAISIDSLADMTQLALQNVDLNNPTSIDVGADGRLYVSQQNGLIVALTVEKVTVPNASGVEISTYTVTDREDITPIQDMPNHDDSGVYLPNVDGRQITGIALDEDSDGNVVIYVSSSDPRIGGGPSGEDKKLDTNSGILSRLTQQPDGSWDKVDLVRGLPRSEENHATNGLQLTTNDQGEDILLLTVGGSTNMGAPSNNFAYIPEYYYSASVVEIDLGKLEAMETAGDIKSYTPPGSDVAQAYLYDLPTLDDPTRENDADGGDLAGDGSQTADVFGGNDGLNQAIYDPLEIVSVVYSGFRNHYDILVTPSGEVYTVDNGSNGGWGGIPVNASGEEVTGGDGLSDPGPAVNLPNNVGTPNADSLLRLDGNIWQADTAMYYGGHPNLYRAYGADAGLYLYAKPDNPWDVPTGTPLGFENGVLVPADAPVDLMPFIPNADQITGFDESGAPLIDPQQAIHLGTGVREEGLTNTANGALWTFFSSTNGLDIYTAPGDMQGELIAVSFNGSIYSVEIGPDGTVTDVESRTLTSKPLDLVAQGAEDPFPGMIFVAAYGADQIVILSPEAGVGVTPNPFDRDEDGIDDTIDPFAADPNNGMLDVISAGQTLEWTFVNGDSFPNDRDGLFDGTGGFFNGGDIGFTGIMTNRGGLPESLYVQDNIIFGGAPGVLQVKTVDPGDATTQTQRNGFQFGTAFDDGVTNFSVSSVIDNYLDDFDTTKAPEKLSQGIYIGAGDQNNFVSVSMVRLEDGRVGFETVSQFAFDFIGETEPSVSFVEVPELSNAGQLSTIELFLDVDVVNETVTSRWSVLTDTGTVAGTGSTIQILGDALLALQGALELPTDDGGTTNTGLAVGVMSSWGGEAQLLPPTVVAALNSGSSKSFVAVIDGQEVTFTPDSETQGVTVHGDTRVFRNKEEDITGTTLDDLHTVERFGYRGSDWGYDIETGNGTYLVDLYFAEIWTGAFDDGVRVFDIEVEGETVRAGFDVFAQVGNYAEYVISVEANVTDGVLDIDFLSDVQNAKLSGVLVREPAPAIDSFSADYDNIKIAAFGAPVPDDIAPSASIVLSGGVVADDPIKAVVTYSDNFGIDQTSLSLDDLNLIGAGTYDIQTQTLEITNGGRMATATYTIQQTGGWTTDLLQVTIDQGAVTDIAGNEIDGQSSVFAFGDPSADDFVFALNAGGDEYTATDGTVFAADTLGVGNSTKLGIPISGTEDDELYQSETWQAGGFEYDIAVNNGTYRVDLYFAETFGQINAVGERVFDIYLEDELVFDNVDVFDSAGGQFAAYKLSAVVNVNDSALTIRADSEAQNPMISGFSVWSYDVEVG